MQTLQAPSGFNTLKEPLGFLEIPRLLLSANSLIKVPKGNGQPVMVVPGFATDDSSTFLLRSYLNMIGFKTRGWGLGRNKGEVDTLLPEVVEQVQKYHRKAGMRINLVGWSLGGYLAREVSREMPEMVNQVITFGSPVIGGPKYTAVGKRYERRGVDLDAIEAAVAERNREPLKVPLTVIYSKSDGVVSWQACLDHVNEDADHYEVNSTHVGLGFSADVYRIIVSKLHEHHTIS